MKMRKITCMAIAAFGSLVSLQAQEIGGIKLDTKQDAVKISTRKGYTQYIQNGEKKLRPYDYIDFTTNDFKRTLRYDPHQLTLGVIFDGHELNYQNIGHADAYRLKVGNKVVGTGKKLVEKFTFSGGENGGKATFRWVDEEVAEVDSVLSVFPGDSAVYLHLKFVPKDKSAKVTLLLGMNPNGICVTDKEPMIIEDGNSVVQCAQNLRKNGLFRETGVTGNLLVKRPGTAKIKKWSGAAGFVFDKEKVSAINQVGYGTLELELKEGVQDFNLAFVDFYRPDEFTEAISADFSKKFKEQAETVRKTFLSGRHQ